MLTGVKGNLTMVGLNTLAQKVFWNGTEIAGIKQIKVDVYDDDRVVKLVIEGNDNALYAELAQAGIQVKKQGAKRNG